MLQKTADCAVGPRRGEKPRRGETHPRLGHIAGRDIAGRDIAGGDIAGRDIAGRDIARRDIAGRDIAGRNASARPLLKWAGGKRQLLHEILHRLPDEISTYYEPFVGGGAVFFALAAERRFERAVLSDQNQELIATYQAVRDCLGKVIAALKTLPHTEEAYYRIRAQRPRLMERVAARMIYLNRTGYNGLYRVNRSGQFNVPFGRYARPNICDEERLVAVSRALFGVRLQVADFERTVQRASYGDAVYFDPPYVPVSSTAKFAEYQSRAFDDAEHQRLARTYRRLLDRGVTSVLSNSDTPRTRELYADCEHTFVAARRSINSAADRRGVTSELLVFGGSEVSCERAEAAG